MIRRISLHLHLQSRPPVASAMHAAQLHAPLEQVPVLPQYELAHLLSSIEKLPLPILGRVFPFGTQPEISLGRLHPHVEKDILSSLVVPSSQFNVLRRHSQAEGEAAPSPTWSGALGP
jgi:hypothetical protein